MLGFPRRTRSRDALILAYHNVVQPNETISGDRSLHLSADDFERQLKQIRAEADILPLSELLDLARRSRRNTHRVVAITFDDAYASAMQLGLSICDGANAPATVFVAPNLLGTIPPWDYLSSQGKWSESDREGFLWKSAGRLPVGYQRECVAEPIAAPLRIATEELLVSTLTGTIHTVGNHTLDHVNLGAVNTAEARDQIEQTSIWLKARFPSQVVPVLSYPYGIAPSEPSVAIVGAALRFAVRVDGGWLGGGSTIDPLAIPRWNVPAGVSARGFALRLRGWLTSR